MDLSILNNEQKEAVETLDGPLLISASAGTGKTRVLTMRYANIVNQGKAPANNILAVTFTNKAANEMKARLSQLLGHKVGHLWIGTFHSIGMRILRKHSDLFQRNSTFTILDMSDQSSLIRKILKSMGLDQKCTPATVSMKINAWKQDALSPHEIFDERDPVMLRVYKEYEERTQSLNAFDFGDLLMLSLKLFKNHDDILSEYHEQFKYILVDEYQDVNNVQYTWLKLLSRGNGNICCVGDDDQSIYGWRGANVENILRFSYDFPQAKIIKLVQNYRSQPRIVSAASHLISHNRERYKKELRTDKPIGDKIAVYGLWNSTDEASFVIKKIMDMHHSGERLSGIAILVRASFQTREFEEQLIAKGIPYRIVGSAKFYDRQEIRDIMAYFRAIYSKYDDLAFERALHTPKKGIGETSVGYIHDICASYSIPLQEGAQRLCELAPSPIRSSARESIKAFLAKIESWRDTSQKITPASLAGQIFKESGLLEMLSKQDDAQAESRIENVKDLIKSMTSFSNLREFLEHASLLSENADEEAQESVSIMTMHAAKGLEFEIVFLPGWEEGTFPHSRCIEERGVKGVEEERRLAYVAITRAMRVSVISFCWNRKVSYYGGWSSMAPSRFINELPQDEVELYMNVQSQVKHQKQQYPQSQSNQNAPIIQNSGSKFLRGDIVIHPIFGQGSVREFNGTYVSVIFKCGSIKRLMPNFIQKI